MYNVNKVITHAYWFATKPLDFDLIREHTALIQSINVLLES